MTTTSSCTSGVRQQNSSREVSQTGKPSIKSAGNHNQEHNSNMMNNDHSRAKERQPHKAVHFCEQANTELTIECNFSADVCQALWYSQAEFEEMKSSRHQTVKRQSSSSSSGCTDETKCLRGLEKLLPQGKHIQKHRRIAIRSIVQMYRQINSTVPSCHDDEEEGDEVLRAFAISKTRYAQHTAKFVAAQDAAAALSGSSEYCCCCKPSWEYPSASELRVSPERSNHNTTASPRMSPNSNKAMTGANKRPSLKQVQRRVPMRAPTA